MNKVVVSPKIETLRLTSTASVGWLESESLQTDLEDILDIVALWGAGSVLQCSEDNPDFVHGSDLVHGALNRCMNFLQVSTSELDQVSLAMLYRVVVTHQPLFDKGKNIFLCGGTTEQKALTLVLFLVFLGEKASVAVKRVREVLGFEVLTKNQEAAVHAVAVQLRKNT